VVLSKYFNEELYNAEFNPSFLQFWLQICNDGFDKWSNTSSRKENDKFDWYIKPMKEGVNFTMSP
jgi:hypothetical protein